MLFGRDKVSFLNLPTPIEYLANVSADLGIELYIKRDDLTSIGLGGNKLRKLEYIVKDARDKGATMLITCGDVQTNHGRQTAAVAAKCGFKCALALIGKKPEQLTSNLLLDHLFGADVVFYERDNNPWPVQCDHIMKSTAEFYESRGERVYEIPCGASNTLGFLGYYECAMEITQQAQEMNLTDAKVCVSYGSLGTFLGLYCGLRNENSPLSTIPIMVSPNYGEKECMQYWDEIRNTYPMSFDLEWDDLHVETGYVHDGYNIPNQHVRKAIEYLASREGIVLDPTYTGKCFAGLIDMVHEGRIRKGEKIIFVHTGGWPLIYAEGHREGFEEDFCFNGKCST